MGGRGKGGRPRREDMRKNVALYYCRLIVWYSFDPWKLPRVQTTVQNYILWVPKTSSKPPAVIIKERKVDWHLKYATSKKIVIFIWDIIK